MSYVNVFESGHLLLFEGYIEDFDYIFIWNLDTNFYTFLEETYDCNLIQCKDVIDFDKISLDDQIDPPKLGEFFFYKNYDHSVEILHSKYNKYIEERTDLKNKIKDLDSLIQSKERYPELWDNNEDIMDYVTYKKKYYECLLNGLQVKCRP